jgi:arylsulfatase A-like enzyme
VEGPDGRRLNGWRFESCRFPTVVRAEDSDTAYMTGKAIDFMEDAGEEPWLLHLSYVKPHWPNVAPAPYHELYDPASVPPPVRHRDELEYSHPLLIPFREERRSRPLDDEETWRRMRATYYGLISEIDAQLGRLFEYMESKGRFDDTLIVFVSDHGEYMGDHWLFEKELFYEAAVRVPLIVYNPSAAADAARGQSSDLFVESVDILPTCLDALAQPMPDAVQGRSLLPITTGVQPSDWRDAVFGDWDFRFYRSSKELGLAPEKCRAWMVRDDRYKYVHFNGLPDMLFDLYLDPDELRNVAEEADYREVVHACRERLLDWRQGSEDNSRGAVLERRIGRIGVPWVPDGDL